MRLFAIFLGSLLFACQNRQAESTSELPTDSTLVGRDRDAHGCIGSAGYTWSAARDTCIRLFEAGSRFVSYDPLTGNEDSTQSAYLVWSDDLSKAEAFFSSSDKPVLLTSVPVVEGETMPILFENQTEMVKLRYHRDTYQILYKDTIRYIQPYSAKNGLGERLKK